MNLVNWVEIKVVFITENMETLLTQLAWEQWGIQ